MRRFGALAVENGGRRAGLAAFVLAQGDIEGIVNALQRAVPGPQPEIAVHRALARKVLGQMAPRAAVLQHIKQPANHRTDVDLARTTAALGRWGQGCQHRPFPVRQVAGVAQSRSVVACPARLGPHLVPFPIFGTTYRKTSDSSDSTSCRTGSQRRSGNPQRCWNVQYWLWFGVEE